MPMPRTIRSAIRESILAFRSLKWPSMMRKMGDLNVSNPGAKISLSALRRWMMSSLIEVSIKVPRNTVPKHKQKVFEKLPDKRNWARLISNYDPFRKLKIINIDVRVGKTD